MHCIVQTKNPRQMFEVYRGWSTTDYVTILEGLHEGIIRETVKTKI